MRAYLRSVVLFFVVLWTNLPIGASTGFGMELLMNKLAALQDKLIEMERAIGQLQTDSAQLLARSRGPYASCRLEPSKISGRYWIQPPASTGPFEVYCEQDKYDGGWIVVQHRFDGSENFDRGLHEYETGFGSVDGEFWFGLARLHAITSRRPHELLVEVKDFEGNYGFAHYRSFAIGSAEERYALKVLEGYRGTAGDSMTVSLNSTFLVNATLNSRKFPKSTLLLAPWWNTPSMRANLNGNYVPVKDSKVVMVWYTLASDYRGLSYSRMMIRDGRTGQ